MDRYFMPKRMMRGFLAAQSCKQGIPTKTLYTLGQVILLVMRCIIGNRNYVLEDKFALIPYSLQPILGERKRVFIPHIPYLLLNCMNNRIVCVGPDYQRDPNPIPLHTWYSPQNPTIHDLAYKVPADAMKIYTWCVLRVEFLNWVKSLTFNQDQAKNIYHLSEVFGLLTTYLMRPDLQTDDSDIFNIEHSPLGPIFSRKYVHITEFGVLVTRCGVLNLIDVRTIRLEHPRNPVIFLASSVNTILPRRGSSNFSEMCFGHDLYLPARVRSTTLGPFMRVIIDLRFWIKSIPRGFIELIRNTASMARNGISVYKAASCKTGLFGVALVNRTNKIITVSDTKPIARLVITKFNAVKPGVTCYLETFSNNKVGTSRLRLQEWKYNADNRHRTGFCIMTTSLFVMLPEEIITVLIDSKEVRTEKSLQPSCPHFTPSIQLLRLGLDAYVEDVYDQHIRLRLINTGGEPKTINRGIDLGECHLLVTHPTKPEEEDPSSPLYWIADDKNTFCIRNDENYNISEYSTIDIPTNNPPLEASHWHGYIQLQDRITPKRYDPKKGGVFIHGESIEALKHGINITITNCGSGTAIIEKGARLASGNLLEYHRPWTPWTAARVGRSPDKQKYLAELLQNQDPKYVQICPGGMKYLRKCVSDVFPPVRKPESPQHDGGETEELVIDEDPQPKMMKFES